MIGQWSTGFRIWNMDMGTLGTEGTLLSPTTSQAFRDDADHLPLSSPWAGQTSPLSLITRPSLGACSEPQLDVWVSEKRRPPPLGIRP